MAPAGSDLTPAAAQGLARHEQVKATMCCALPCPGEAQVAGASSVALLCAWAGFTLASPCNLRSRETSQVHARIVKHASCLSPQSFAHDLVILVSP